MKKTIKRVFVSYLLIWNTVSLAQTSAVDTVFSINKTPIWDYVFLRNTTKEFLETAKGLEQNLISFKDKVGSEEERRLALQQAVEMADLNRSLANLGVSYADQSKAISEKNADIANLRVGNKDAQISEGAGTLRFMKKKHEEIESRGFWRQVGRVAAGVTAAAATMVSMGASGIVGASLHLTGAFGGAIAEERDIDDRDAITERQTQDQINQMARERAELEAMSIVAQEQIELDSISLRQAFKNLEIADTEYSHAVEMLNLFNNDTSLYPKKEIIKELEKILDTYIQYSIVLARLTEKAYQAEEVVISDVVKSYVDYTTGSTGSWLAADRILLDLNTIEFSRITQKKQKPNFSTYTLSLRNKDPIQLEQLRTRGLMNFDITQFELDLAFPGTYARTIKDIDVNVIALADAGGIKGQLTKEGLSWKKVPAGIAGEYSIDDWLKYVPSGYKAMIFADETETLIFPRFRGVSQTPGLLDVLEGKALCGTYTLELPKYSNRFDYNTIVDVIITIQFASYFDPVLKAMVETEICEMHRAQEFSNSRILSVSMPLIQPDEWYEFRNPVEQDTLWHKRRYLPFFIERGYLPTNQLNPRLNELSVSFLYHNRFANFKFSVTSMAMNPQSELAGQDGQIDPLHLDTLQLEWRSNFAPLVGKSSPGSVENDTVFVHYANSDPLNPDSLSWKQTNMPDSSDEAYELWILKIEAKDNPLLSKKDNVNEFDESKLLEIQDVAMNFGYRFSYDFCQFSGRVYAYMDVDEDTTWVRGIDAQRHKVPYLHVREGGRPVKKTQERLAWYEWKPSIADSSFTLERIIHKDEYADLVPFYSFLRTKTPIEEIEVKFDLKNVGDEAIIYGSPSWIAMKVKKVSRDELELKFQVDLEKREMFKEDSIFLLRPQRVTVSIKKDKDITGPQPPGKTNRFTIPTRQKFDVLGDPGKKLSKPERIASQKKGVIESDSYFFKGQPVHLIFRYLNLPGLESLSTVDVTILEYESARGNPKYSRLFNRPPLFYRWRNDSETNFALRIHRDDYPGVKDKPNFILRDLKFSDYARF
ncbi:MAG: hypothetical protein CV087_16720 [Candidatus Brocadia sp. WS118]|nr:MAG: hypothetical protein CV087_16720 [Candidatus Brocadia sp. WS118]